MTKKMNISIEQYIDKDHVGIASRLYIDGLYIKSFLEYIAAYNADHDSISSFHATCIFLDKMNLLNDILLRHTYLFFKQERLGSEQYTYPDSLTLDLYSYTYEYKRESGNYNL